jgi:hypothetical protein
MAIRDLELDIGAEDLPNQLGLCNVMRLLIETDDPLRTTHFGHCRIKSRVTAYVEDRLAGELSGKPMPIEGSYDVQTQVRAGCLEPLPGRIFDDDTLIVPPRPSRVDLR